MWITSMCSAGGHPKRVKLLFLSASSAVVVLSLVEVQI